jgi:hypothetical protein
LRAVIDEYHRFNPNEQSWANCDLESITWYQVLDVLEETQRHYRDTNPVRRKFRHGGLFSRVGIPFLESIPNDKGFGLIKAGLMVLFNVRVYVK